MSRDRTMVGTGTLVAAMAALAAALIVALFYYAAPSKAAASGTTIVVNTKKDESNTDGDCSLREAIKAANSNKRVDRCSAGSATEGDTVRFSLGKKATITLRSQLPYITDGAGLTINGGKAKITVSGNDSVRVFIVDRDAELALSKLKVAKGRADSSGGIYNWGRLTVSNSTISGNSASHSGGGIANEGILTVTNSTISGNNASGGGGIVNTYYGWLRVTNSTISGNSSNRYGGGVYNEGTLTVSNSTISGNSADEDGGGIVNRSTLTVSNSTFFGNSADFDGGGIYNEGTLTVSNSTFSGNSASRSGGGIDHFHGTTTLRNTIVANSPSGGNCAGLLTDGGYNIEDGTSCGFSEANNSLPSTDPLLSALDNYGGPTKTHALEDGSPAINRIPNGTNDCATEINKDQRGVDRPQGNECDIGSFEKEL